MLSLNIRRAVRATLVLAAAHAAAASAAPPSSSAYATDPQSSHVEDATSHGIGQVNMIACFMAAMRPDALVNDGPYIALVDETKCDSEGRSSSANSGGGNEGAQAAAYTTATVDSTRASNSDPMIAKVWVDESEEGRNATIFARVSATAPPSATNPYGEFRLDFCGKGGSLPGCMMQGYLEGTATGLSFYQNEGEGGGGAHTVALRLSTTGTASGSGRMQLDEQGAQAAFNFAYNQSLFRRSDDTEDQCFSRDASDAETGFSVWRYGLYDAVTGARITRNSGFPIEYTAGGHTYRGYLGYWGLSLSGEGGALMANGDTVQKVDYSSGQDATRTSYTVLKAGGKLVKYTKKTRTLRAMDKIKFTTFVGNDASLFFLGAEANTQYELYWNDATGAFIVTGQMNCGPNGCQTADLESPQTVAISYWAARGGVQGWSQSLGGEVFIDLHAVTDPVDSVGVPVVYRTQDLVYPSDLPATLFCLQNCPTAASMASYFAPGSGDASPYESMTFNNWNPTPSAAVVTYTTDQAAATLRDGAGQAVTFTDAEAYRQRPQYQWGVRSGRLFTTLASAECDLGSGTFCDWRTNSLEVYYQWETGPNPWSQFAAVKDSAGNFVTFDAPLQVTYDVPSGAAYGQYAGKSIVLQYGGFGDLWGIPGNCVSRVTNEQVSCETENARYVPSFVIPFDETNGRVTGDAGTWLVKWLDREIRFARKDPSVCAAAGLNLPNGVTLPTAADLKDPSNASSDIYIGAKPSVTSVPRVIHGDVKF